jgi:bifunctional non-homologous end joining protein LigD
MKSWAVPKGPSLDPAVKRLAMQVEDHPIEYNTFEGTIPPGEYGGGTVMLWDRGSYSPDEMKAGEAAEAAVQRGLRAGKLSFTLHGERLHGSFALVRTAAGPRAKWLLIKHRDAYATSHRDIIAEAMTSVDSGRTMQEIAGESTRVWRSRGSAAPGGEERRTPHERTAPDIRPMKPKPVRTLPAGNDWTFEPWHGGERVLAFATAEGARIVDARGRGLTKHTADITAELAALARRTGRPFVLDGELVAAADGGALYLSDLLVDGDRLLLDEPWRVRRRALDALLRRRRLVLLRRLPSSDDGENLRAQAGSRGWSGIYARNVAAKYRPGMRTDDLLRIPAH